jgi:dihydroorotase
MPGQPILILGGTIVDPAAGTHRVADLEIRAGRIARVGIGLTAQPGTRIIAATGAFVTPGLIDLHVHTFVGVSDLAIDPDEHCLVRGVTTVVDAGSAGAITFEAFRQLSSDRMRTRIRAFLNLSSIGLIVDDGLEYASSAYVEPERLARTIDANRDVCLGVKVRVQRSIAGARAGALLDRAIAIAERTGTRVMVHVTDSALEIADILARLRPGDIVTHAFHGKGRTLAEPGVTEAVRDAQERGIVLDVGHGRGSFSFHVAEQLGRLGIWPSTISTDLHQGSMRTPVVDLPTTMAKLLAIGMSFDRVVEAATWRPAIAIGAQADLGHLRPGAVADVAILELEAQERPMVDAHGETRLAPGLRTRAAILGGDVVWVDDVLAGRS